MHHSSTGPRRSAQANCSCSAHPQRSLHLWMEINLFLFSIFICIFLFLYLFLYFCGEMKVIVHVREKVVQVQCGPGTQRLKWLGHVGTSAKISQIADMVLIHY